MSTILKLQMPLASSEPAPKILAYNEDRSVITHLDNEPHLAKWFGGNAKIYVKAKVRKTGSRFAIEIRNTVRDQGW